MHISVPDRAVDLVSQVLVDLGSTGVTTAEKELDTFVVPAADELANDPVLRAYFPCPEDQASLCATVRQALSEWSEVYPELGDCRLDCRQFDEQAWASDWQQHFPPFKVGDRLVIHPSWVDWPGGDEEVVLTLDPGQAFGTGTHATTGLCLEALAGHFASGTPPQTVLDVGTGSGILAMAGAALGARQVIACDIDSAACQVAVENIRQNGLSRLITVTDAPLDEIPGRFDLVLANILAGENLRLASLLVQRLAPCGRLVLSGILIEQEQKVLDGFAAFELELIGKHHRDEWTCLVYRNHE